MPKVLLKSGVRLHYQQMGQGPDIIMLHGLSGDLALWHLHIAPRLWDSFRITTYDLRGHGYSDMPPSGYAAGDMALDLVDLMEALAIERATLIGHCFGADIALYLALKHPERVEQVIAIEAALPALVQSPLRHQAEGSYWISLLESSGVQVPPERREDLDYVLRLSLDIPKRWGPLAGRNRNRKPFLMLLETTTIKEDYAVAGELTLENLPRITTPVALVYSQPSVYQATLGQLQTLLPSTRTIMLPAAEWGHFVPQEQPEALIEHILPLLQPALPAPNQPAAPTT